ncbi:MAG: ParB/RepB/Spo0J family partition protein [Phycisphaerales bacterium]
MAKTKDKRRRLGRGLGSLISSPVAVDIDTSSSSTPAKHGTTAQVVADDGGGHPVSADAGSELSAPAPSEARSQDDDAIRSPGGMVVQIPVEKIVPSPNQPRQVFDDASLDSLASSIRSAGVIQPIVVRPMDPSSGQYELVAGERRLRAARRVPLATIPSIVQDVDEATAAEWALIENLQREDLNPIERAEAFASLIEKRQWTHGELADCVGLERSSVSNIIRLNELDAVCKDAVSCGTLTNGHARALLAVADLNQRHELLARIEKEGLTVRTVEQIAAGLQAEPGQARPSLPSATAPRSAHLDDLERKLSDHLGTRVHIRTGRKKGTGKLIIEFFSLDEFDGLLDRVGYRSG